jgi:hypothetical protein
MTEFLDGPAEGAKLSLGRAPRLLRVVINGAAGVDALDQLDDQAERCESIYVYRLEGAPQHGFACSRSKGCQLLVFARYRLYHDQPDDATMRDNAAWRAWAKAQPDDLTKPLRSKT